MKRIMCLWIMAAAMTSMAVTAQSLVRTGESKYGKVIMNTEGHVPAAILIIINCN